MSYRMTNPPQSPAEILDVLRSRYAMTEVSDLLAALLSDDEEPHPSSAFRSP